MNANLTHTKIEEFLQKLGAQCPQTTALYLLGGTALYLLGSTRPTKDIDYVGNDLPSHQDPFASLIQQIARELQISVEAVPIEGFLPVPDGNTERHIHLNTFGFLATYIYDPYTIALSKIDRGFETDLQDVQFLVTQGYVDLPLLEQQATMLESQAAPYLIDVAIFRRHLDTLKKLLKA
jgi:hypothetical protein